MMNYLEELRAEQQRLLESIERRQTRITWVNGLMFLFWVLVAIVYIASKI